MTGEAGALVGLAATGTAEKLTLLTCRGWQSKCPYVS